MKYEEFVDCYDYNLQLLDAIDLLKHFSPEALETLDQLDFGTKVDKNDESRDQKDPIHWVSSLDIQQL